MIPAVGTKARAILNAERRARETGRTQFVVYEPDDFGIDYHAASELDCDTFWLGAPIVASVEPDGTVEHS